MEDGGKRILDGIYMFTVFDKVDTSGNEYEFGFTPKELPQTTYIDEDVGGGKKLSVDYDVIEQMKVS